MTNHSNEMIVHGRLIGADAKGRVCLNDIWYALGQDDNRRPNKWWRSQSAKTLTDALKRKIARDDPGVAPPIDDDVYCA